MRSSMTSSSTTKRASRCWSAQSPSKKSERLSQLLKRRGVKHVVLNAKYHDKEAEIVAQAGKKGAVTIATNMAGPWYGHHAGRPTPSIWRKRKMRRMQYPEELISEADAHSDTDNEEILEARKTLPGAQQQI